MSHPRRTAASLLLALSLTLLPPGGAHALPLPAEAAPEAAGEPAGTVPGAPAALTAAWDWLLSLVSLAASPREDQDGTRTEVKLPGCFEGSHLDPNGSSR